jgi:hypothetical protein
MPNLNQEELRRLARLGALARLEELRREEAAIRAEFPDLFRGRGAAGGAGSAAPRGRRRGRPAATGAGKAGGRRMSAANRKAVSARMKKYWAERRKAKAAK